MTSLTIEHRGALSGLLAAAVRHLHRYDQVVVALPRGAVVVVGRTPDGLRTVTIERAERPATPDAWKRWSVEIETFRKHLRLQRWDSVSVAATVAGDGVAVRFVELGEVGR